MGSFHHTSLTMIKAKIPNVDMITKMDKVFWTHQHKVNYNHVALVGHLSDRLSYNKNKWKVNGYKTSKYANKKFLKFSTR